MYVKIVELASIRQLLGVTYMERYQHISPGAY